MNQLIFRNLHCGVAGEVTIQESWWSRLEDRGMYQTKALGAPLAKLRADSISWSWHKIRLRHPILLPSQRFAAHDGYPRYVFVAICLLTISRWVSSKATRACWHHLHVLNRMLAIIGKRRPNIWGCEGKHELIWSTTVDNNLVEQNQLMT